MERRAGDFELLHVLSDIIPSFSIENNESKSKLKILSRGGDREKGVGTGVGTGVGVNGGILDPVSTEDSKRSVVSGMYEGEGNAALKASSNIRELLASRMSSTARTEVRSLCTLYLLSVINDRIVFVFPYFS